MSEERFKDWKMPVIEHNKLTKWNWVVSHPENLTLGKNTDIGAFTYIDAMYGVEIGDNVQIGSHCSVYSHDTIRNIKGKVIIGDNARIGSFCLILPNARIESNAFIKAYSIVDYKNVFMKRQNLEVIRSK